MWLVNITSTRGSLPYRITKGDAIVGRTQPAQIVIAERTVSRVHARMAYDGETLAVEDRDSLNGTFVNEVAVSQSELKLGDHVRFGGVACAISAVQVFLGTVTEEDSTYPMPQSKTGDTLLMDTFTAAHLQIIPLLMKGKSEPEISETLGKSFHTIHNQVRAIFERAGVHSREELIVKLLGRR